MSSLDDLIGGARQLQAKIQRDSELPPLRRNIQQIQSQARERAANVQALDGPAETDAQTFRFLAKQGIDANALDPMAIDLIPGGPAGAGAGADDQFGSEDLESFLQREEQRILVDVRRPRRPPPRAPYPPPSVLSRRSSPRPAPQLFPLGADRRAQQADDDCRVLALVLEQA